MCLVFVRKGGYNWCVVFVCVCVCVCGVCALFVYVCACVLGHCNFVPDGRGITRLVSQGILTDFQEALQHCCPLLWSHRVPWGIQHKAPGHTAGITQNFLCYHSLPHLGYSAELNPCDYWLFTVIKKDMQHIRHHTVQ